MSVKLLSSILFLAVFQLIAAASGREPSPPCRADFPILTGADRRPLWLKTPQLLDQSSHCEGPKLEQLRGERARIQGTVILSLLVDQHGTTRCIKAASGHPLLLRVAIDAAEKWKFKPKVEGGKSVGFYGILEFHFSDGDDNSKRASCTDAHL